MKQYLDLLQDILDNGQREPNRTGIDTLTLPGAMLKFDLRDGFPAVTTKKLAWKQVVGELIGFLRGSRDVRDFEALGCTVWDANVAAPAWQANHACLSEVDMGRIYGTQWRDWPQMVEQSWDDMGNEVWQRQSLDQIAVALDTVRNNPENRRIIVNAWNPAELDQATLPPCHVLFQLLPRSDGTLHMTMYQRSCDMFLGVPFNIASYALLLELFAAWTGRRAATLTMFLADAHIYVNHIDQVEQQLSREPLPAPKLLLRMDGTATTDDLETLLAKLDNTSEFPTAELIGYQSYAAIKAPMAV